MTASQRFTVFCQSNAGFARQQIRTYLATQPGVRSLWLAKQSQPEQQIISQTQANQSLGQEADVLVFDASEMCRPDALGAALGTLRGGGVFFMLLPDDTQSLWLQRFIKLAAQFAADSPQACFWQTALAWPDLPAVSVSDQSFQLTAEQRIALEAIDKVLHGHRRRPLLITADRGRGKSALLGIAAAQCIEQGKSRVLVTAPSKSAVATLFEHAQRHLGNDELHTGLLSKIRFVPPDVLLQSLPSADILLVDEAAALPQPVLQQLLRHYSRMVFASTLHGYEGSGLGFKYQFAKLLDQQTPGWQAITLNEPVRWPAADPLEQFSYQALLLNAVLTTAAQPINKPGKQQLTTLTALQLLEDETLLREVFALLVAAHYRTRPSDLQALLDDHNRSVWLLRDQQQLVAVCWLNQEGPLEPELAKAVHQGQRRLHGELLPQSLLTHAGDLQAANLNYQRIIRIAVRPEYQQQGLGSGLLEKLMLQLPPQTDLLGCSFAMQTGLLDFWLKNGFLPVRLGLHEDTVSAGRAVVMLKACSDNGAAQITALQQRLAQQWPLLLTRYYADLPADLVITISHCLPATAPVLTEDDQLDIDSFINGQRALAFSFVPLQHWLWQQFYSDKFAHCTAAQQALLVQVFFQQQPLSVICQQHQLKGQKVLLTALRQALRLLTD